MRGKMRKKNKGFSLAELMISITILVIVSVMVAVIFRSTQSSFMNARAFQHVIDLARTTVTRMQNNIKAMYVDSTGIISLVGIDATGTKIKTNSQADEIFFIVPETANTLGDICEIGYWQRDDGNIMRHIDTAPDFNYSSVTSDDELGLVVSNLEFKYSDGTTYFNSWDSRIGGANEGEFPKVIEFSFEVSDATSIVRKKFQSVVRIASTGR
jgi:prepilin-type N-terminal cleavage/methylation domain-containing protein